MLKKYVKNVQPPVEDRSYTEARKMMNQNGYTEEETSWGAKLIQNLITKSHQELENPYRLMI